MGLLKIALAQIKQTNDLEQNGERILRYLDQAAQAGVQIVCFPEAQTAGYRVDITSPDAPVQVEQLESLHHTIAESCGRHGMASIVGTEIPLETDAFEGKPYNSAMVISERGEILGCHHKTKLTPLDAVAYSAGREINTYQFIRSDRGCGDLLRGIPIRGNNQGMCTSGCTDRFPPPEQYHPPKRLEDSDSSRDDHYACGREHDMVRLLQLCPRPVSELPDSDHRAQRRDSRRMRDEAGKTVDQRHRCR